MVSVQEDMRQAGVADYMLIRFKEREKEKLSEKLAGLVRASDVIGADENGALYLLLIQTNKKITGISERGWNLISWNLSWWIE